MRSYIASAKYARRVASTAHTKWRHTPNGATQPEWGHSSL